MAPQRFLRVIKVLENNFVSSGASRRFAPTLLPLRQEKFSGITIILTVEERAWAAPGSPVMGNNFRAGVDLLE
jgi:hypothetical protein